MSIEPYKRLVHLAARAFYDDVTFEGENQPTDGRSDNRGMAVVVLDALTRREWVKEEDLARDLKLHPEQLGRMLRFLEEEKFVTRDHQREDANVSPAEGEPVAEEGEEETEMDACYYCCIDYPQICDVVRYRMHRMKRKLEDELENGNAIQEYVCPTCKLKHLSITEAQLISADEGHLSCETCNAELIAESDKPAAAEKKDMLQRMDEQLIPLTLQLARVRGLPARSYGSLQAWQARVNDPYLQRINAGSGTNYFASSPCLPYFRETTVTVGPLLEDDDDGNSTAPRRGWPPWCIKFPATLTAEQRGKARSELEPGSTSANGEQQLMQEQNDAATTAQSDSNLGPSSERSAGMKIKRGYVVLDLSSDDSTSGDYTISEDDDDDEW